MDAVIGLENQFRAQTLAVRAVHIKEMEMDHDAAKLAEGLRDHDLDVLDRLIEKYRHRLYRYLLSITGNQATADDVFQETWLHVLERGYQYRAQWKFEVWLFSIARHLVIDLARRKKSDSLDELINPEHGAGMELPAIGPSAIDALLLEEESALISRCLARVPAGYREVLTLRFQEEMTLEEIAAVLKAPLSTVKSRLYRGLDAVRSEMG